MPPSPSRRPLVAFLAAVALTAATFAAWWFVARPRPPQGDPVAATAANVRGIGQMEQFDYPKAAAEFREAARLAPGWLPARINLGMALYNSASRTDDPVLAEAIAVFEQVLADDPNNLYAHFNLGIIHKYQANYPAAIRHFTAVTEADPKDDRAWLYLAQSNVNAQTDPEALRLFQKALELNPYLVPAWHGVANHVATSADEQKRLIALQDDLRRANWEDEARDTKHSEQGRYATAIGRPPLVKPAAVGPPPMFRQKAAWTIDLPDNPDGVLVRLDFDRDGKPDLLLRSAAGDRLLRNDGGKFTDVTAAVGLTGGGRACAVGDYDNDGWPDLVLAGPTGLKLLRNAGGKKFEDVTTAAGFDKLPGEYRTLLWLDIDQDGDLDLLAATGGAVELFQNVGVAPPSRFDEPTPPMTTAFKRLDPLHKSDAAVTGVVALDIDGDKDVDLVILQKDKPAAVILNDRLMRFKAGGPLPVVSNDLVGGLVLDANGDDQSDLLFVSGGKPAFLVSKQELPGTDFAKRFTAGATDSPPLLHAQRCDLDQDGRADVVGLSRDGKAVFLQGDGEGKLTNVPEPFGPAVDALGRLHAVAAADVDGDGTPDVVVWHEKGLAVFPGVPNGHHTARASFTGKRDNSNAGIGQKNLRTNTDGIGTKAVAMTGALRPMVELTTLESGPGQSLLPAEFGLGKATQIDALRIRWPDCVVQAELGVPAGAPFAVSELNRKPTSCPVLMTWDGEKWVYITDFLGGGAMGECGADGTCRPPRPEESVTIEPHQLGLRNGRYVLRIAEPMDEVMYLDHVRLDVIDHPADAVVYPDERFATAAPAPTQKLQQFRTRVFPAKATDHRGVDRTKTILTRDGVTVDGFAQRSWLGFAENHWLELDFADRLAGLPTDKPLSLMLAGWTDYPYPESIIAAAQAGVNMAPPVLERQTADGKWEPLGEVGFPAGLPKVMTVPAGDWFRTGSRFRLRTNLQIYWDQVFVGVVEEPAAVTQLKPQSVVLSHPGFVQEVRTNGKLPQAYDPERFEPVAVTKWAGKLTKLGDVTELTADVDDRFVLCGPGDEVTVTFDPAALPKLPAGWKRSFVLRTHGYCKDTSPTTVTGGQVGPLPFRGMGNYPPAEPRPKAIPDDAAWHTRPAGGR